MSKEVNKDLSKVSIRDKEVFTFKGMSEGIAYYESTVSNYDNESMPYINHIEIDVEYLTDLECATQWKYLKSEYIVLITEIRNFGSESKLIYRNDEDTEVDEDYINNMEIDMGVMFIDGKDNTNTLNHIIESIGADEMINKVLDYKNKNNGSK